MNQDYEIIYKGIVDSMVDRCIDDIQAIQSDLIIHGEAMHRVREDGTIEHIPRELWRPDYVPEKV